MVPVGCGDEPRRCSLSPRGRANHEQLLGLLIGTNVGPIVVPWASPATLLRYERRRAAGVRIAWPRFMLTAACTLAATTWTLIATPPL